MTPEHDDKPPHCSIGRIRTYDPSLNRRAHYHCATMKCFCDRGWTCTNEARRLMVYSHLELLLSDTTNVHLDGIEPSTVRLKGGYSTTELQTHGAAPQTRTEYLHITRVLLYLMS